MLMLMKRSCLTAAVIAMASPALGAGIPATDADYPSYQPSAAVKNGFSAEDIRDAEVRGANGDKIGEVKDLIIGPDGELRRLVVSVNEGFLGTGGRRLAVNWQDVTPGPKTDHELKYVTVPVSNKNIEESGLFKDKPEAVEGKPREWRASELIGDSVDLKDVDGYGSVTDLMFDREGQLRAVAAAPDLNSPLLEYYAPYSGDDAGWDPGDDYYVIPYTQQEIQDLLPPEQARNN